MVPEWLQIALPFVSGAAGVLLTLKVGIARLETSVKHLTCQVIDNRKKLEKQVGDDRCHDQREECQGRIEKRLDGIQAGIESNRMYVGDKFDGIQRELVGISIWMAKHSGD